MESEELLEPRGSEQSDEFYYRSSPPAKSFSRHAVVYTALVLCNITMIGLWVHARFFHVVVDNQQCVRPQLTWCESAAFNHNLLHT
jgi:hypothetical protein